jgi:hypothetical protein
MTDHFLTFTHTYTIKKTSHNTALVIEITIATAADDLMAWTYFQISRWLCRWSAKAAIIKWEVQHYETLNYFL